MTKIKKTEILMSVCPVVTIFVAGYAAFGFFAGLIAAAVISMIVWLILAGE